MQIINPNGRSYLKYEALEPPIWAGFIANLENASLIDAEVEDLTPEQTAGRIKHKEVLIVVMGKNPSVSSSPKMKFVYELLPLLRDRTVKLTGIHPQALKSEIERETGCEVVSYNPQDFTYMHCPDFSKYKAHNWHCMGYGSRSPYGVLVTSFGCPFDCFYCNIHTLYPREMIYRDTNMIASELNHLLLCHVPHVKIWDELFALNEKRVLDICELLSYYPFNIWAYARVDTINKKMLKAMKKGGINWLAYGMDSKCDLNTIKRAISMTHEEDINVLGNFMFGLPNENPIDVLQVSKSLDIEWANFYVARPYPGSKWYEKEKVQFELLNQYGGMKDSLRIFRDKAFKSFYSRPEYLEKIEKRFGTESRDEIINMVKGD